MSVLLLARFATFALVAAVPLSHAAGCFPLEPMEPADSVVVGLPRALVECAAPPLDLAARLWVSGSATPCELEVNLDEGTTTGACPATPGRVRALTIDWFIPGDGSVDVVLAQARRELDLTQADEATVELTVGDDEVKTSGCRDMTSDQLEGSPTISLDGLVVPVCDVDDSCTGSPDPACSNIGEVCAGSDPFDPSVEP